MSIEFSLNHKLQISKDGRDWYVTSLQEQDNENFSIGIPYKKSQPLIFYPGEKAIIKFTTENASYEFHTRVLYKKEDQHITLYVLPWPDAVERVQQRDFVRMSKIIPVNYKLLTPAEDDAVEMYETKSIDLSARGMKIVLINPLDIGDKLMVFFELEIKQKVFNKFKLNAQVIRHKIKKIDSKNLIYQAGIEFLDISRHEQDKIMAFIFKNMTKHLRI